MTVSSAAIVASPIITPANFGLLSVAQFPQPGEEHWPLGVMFEEIGAARAFAVDGWCQVPLTAVITANAGTAEVQTITIAPAPTAGSFTLSGGVNGTGTTAAIAFNADGPTGVQPALQALPGFAGVTVTGPASGPYVVTFPAELGNLPLLTADSTALTGGAATVAETTPGSPPGNTTTEQGVPYGESATVTVFAVFDCSAVGRNVDAARQLAQTRLEYAAPRALERAVWTGKDSLAATIAGQHLADAATTDVLDATATDLVTAVGALEEWVGDNYAGQGVLHAPRRAGASFDRFQLHDTVSGHKETGLGNRVAFGRGYDGSAVDGTAAPAGQTWLYATPAVMVLQGQDVIEPDLDHAMNVAANGLVMAAQRQYLVAWETGAAAVLATLGA